MSELPSNVLKQRKRAIRREVIARRDALSSEVRSDASARIAATVMELPEVQAARTVMAFWSFGSEVDTAPLIERLHAADRRVVLPRVEGADVVGVLYLAGDEVSAAAFGAMQPTGAAVVESSEVDLVIVPGVAFDRHGRRVGYGGGYYDRFLPRTRADVPAIAIAFSQQVVDGTLPAASFDRRVDAIVTEDGIVRP